MKLVIAIVGLILTAAWIEQALTLRARRKRRENRVVAQWWKEPPHDGPEEDH